MQNVLFFLNLLVAIFYHAGVSAEAYKWKDENGQTHYGEKPESAGAAEVHIQGNPPVDADVRQRNEEREKMLKVYDEERNIRQDEKHKADEKVRKKMEKCHIAENALKDMQQGRIYDIDEKGERRYLSDTELARRVQKLQEQYRQHCQ